MTVLSLPRLLVAAEAIAPAVEALVRAEMRRIADGRQCFSLRYGQRTNTSGYAGVFSQDINNPGTMFGQTATRKNELTAAHGMPAHVVQAQYPLLLSPEDTQWGGNAYCEATRLIVGGSAFSAIRDQGIAEAVLALWKMELSDDLARQIMVSRALRLPCVGAAGDTTLDQIAPIS